MNSATTAAGSRGWVTGQSYAKRPRALRRGLSTGLNGAMTLAADRALTRPHPRAAAAAAAVLVLVAVGLLAWTAIRPPAVEPAGGFSATRAFQQVETVAAQTTWPGAPRTTGCASTC